MIYKAKLALTDLPKTMNKLLSFLLIFSLVLLAATLSVKYLLPQISPPASPPAIPIPTPTLPNLTFGSGENTLLQNRKKETVQFMSEASYQITNQMDNKEYILNPGKFTSLKGQQLTYLRAGKEVANRVNQHFSFWIKENESLKVTAIDLAIPNIDKAVSNFILPSDLILALVPKESSDGSVTDLVVFR